LNFEAGDGQLSLVPGRWRRPKIEGAKAERCPKPEVLIQESHEWRLAEWAEGQGYASELIFNHGTTLSRWKAEVLLAGEGIY
jgi:hypothetical protein